MGNQPETPPFLARLARTSPSSRQPPASQTGIVGSQEATPPQATLQQADSEPRDIQLRYKLAPATFRTLRTIPSSPSRRDILEKACFAIEFRSFPIKQVERGFFRQINDHTPVPYPIIGNVSQPWHKVFLLVQIDLQRDGWPNKLSAAARKELHQERGRIHNLLDRVLRCLADLLGEKQDGRGVSVALDVLRSVKSGVWEGNAMELLQVEGIGPAKMARLVQAGVKTIKQLRQLDFFRIERLLSRNPPFGHQMLHQLAGFPVLTLNLEAIGQYSRPSTATPGSDKKMQSKNFPEYLCIARFVVGYENNQLPAWNKRNPWTTLVVEGNDGRLVWFWRGSVKRMAENKEIIVGLQASKGEQLKVTLACEEVVGTIVRETLQL